MTRPPQTGIYQYLSRFRHNAPSFNTMNRWGWRCPECYTTRTGYHAEALAKIAHDEHVMRRHR